jgi:hypothetical protein
LGALCLRWLSANTTQELVSLLVQELYNFFKDCTALVFTSPPACPPPSTEATAAFVSLTTLLFGARLLLLTSTCLHALKLLPAGYSVSQYLLRKARATDLEDWMEMTLPQLDR